MSTECAVWSECDFLPAAAICEIVRDAALVFFLTVSSEVVLGPMVSVSFGCAEQEDLEDCLSQKRILAFVI